MKKAKGFTLIELLVIIAIIGLLSTLAVVALNNARQKSRDAKRVSDIKQISTALKLYFADNNGYPVATLPGIALGTGNYKCLSMGGFVLTCGATVYLQLVPANPTPGGAAYTYSSTDGTTYAIQFMLDGPTGILPAGGHTAGPSGIL